MSHRKLLLVTQYRPSRTGGGASQRAQTIFEALAGIGEVHLFLHDFGADAEVPAAIDEPFKALVTSMVRGATLATEARNVWARQLSPGAIHKALRLAWVSTGRMNPPTAAQTDAMVGMLRRQICREKFDAIFAFQAHCALLCTDALPGLLANSGPSFLDWDAAEGPAMRDIWRQSVFKDKRFARLRAVWNSMKLRRYESKLLRSWTVALCASSVDVGYFEARIPGTIVHCLPNAVTIPDSGPSTERRHSAPPQVVFVGSMNYWPNHAGALLFLKEIWPRVRSVLPNAEIKLVGRGPASDLIAYSGRDGVSVVGEVDSVAPYYEAADVAIAPMTFSVGSAIKVLEALAYRRPLVGFEASIRRHGLRDGVHVAIADTPRAFADKLVALLKDPHARAQLAGLGHDYVATYFARPKIVAGLRSLVQETIDGRARSSTVTLR